MRKPITHKVLLLIITLSVALRLGSALFQGNGIEFLPGVFDQVSYHELALRVLDGKGFSFDANWWPATRAEQPTAHWSYLYVLYLAGAYALFGVIPLLPKLLQAILVGVLHPLLTWRITRRISGERVAVAGALLATCYGYFVYYTGALVTEAFYLVAILWVVDVVVAIGQDPKSARAYKPWIHLGIAASIAILLRQVILLAAPLVLIWIWWRIRTHNRQEAGFRTSDILKRFAVSAAIMAAFIAPWTIRNYAAFGTFTLLNTNAGFALFWGNHPIHRTNFVPILDHPSQYGALIPAELLGLNEAELDRALAAEAFHMVAADPLRFAKLSLSRFKEYFKFWPTEESSSLSNAARVLSFGLYLPLFLSGFLAAAWRRFRAPVTQDSPAVLLITGLCAFYTLVHVMSWTLVRYRLPIDTLLMPLGGLGLASLIRSLKTLRSPKLHEPFARVPLHVGALTNRREEDVS